MNAKQLAASLQNVGPVPAENLIAVGIDTPGKLRKIGARRAHEKIFPENNLSCDKFNAAYLYVLERVIPGCDRRQIPESKKLKFKRLTRDLR